MIPFKDLTRRRVEAVSLAYDRGDSGGVELESRRALGEGLSADVDLTYVPIEADEPVSGKELVDHLLHAPANERSVLCEHLSYAEPGMAPLKSGSKSRPARSGTRVHRGCET